MGIYQTQLVFKFEIIKSFFNGQFRMTYLSNFALGNDEKEEKLKFLEILKIWKNFSLVTKNYILEHEKELSITIFSYDDLEKFVSFILFFSELTSSDIHHIFLEVFGPQHVKAYEEKLEACEFIFHDFYFNLIIHCSQHLLLTYYFENIYQNKKTTSQIIIPFKLFYNNLNNGLFNGRYTKMILEKEGLENFEMIFEGNMNFDATQKEPLTKNIILNKILNITDYFSDDHPNSNPFNSLKFKQMIVNSKCLHHTISTGDVVLIRELGTWYYYLYDIETEIKWLQFEAVSEEE